MLSPLSQCCEYFICYEFVSVWFICLSAWIFAHFHVSKENFKRIPFVSFVPLAVPKLLKNVQRDIRHEMMLMNCGKSHRNIHIWHMFVHTLFNADDNIHFELAHYIHLSFSVFHQNALLLLSSSSSSSSSSPLLLLFYVSFLLPFEFEGFIRRVVNDENFKWNFYNTHINTLILCYPIKNYMAF